MNLLLWKLGLMNEFTKEELEEILLGIRHFYVAYNKGLIADKDIDVSSGTLIIDKLQSMIDNYCEHELYNPCMTCNLDKIYCLNCKRGLNDNQ